MHTLGHNNMKEAIINLFLSIDPNWAVFWISMFPVTELRASIPLGIEVFGLSPIKTMLIAIIGDMVPALFILFLLPYVHEWVVQQKILGPIITNRLESAEKKFGGKYAKYGAIGLILFVGIPLPLTGSWTGSLAAFIFNIPFKKSVPLIFAGVCIAAIVVTLITLFAGETAQLFL